MWYLVRGALSIIDSEKMLGSGASVDARAGLLQSLAGDVAGLLGPS